jgi:hypothetical protein
MEESIKIQDDAIEAQELVKSKSSQYVKTYYEKHPEKRIKLLEYSKKWRANQIATNKEAFLESRRIINRQFYAKNKDKINLQCRNRYAKNKELICQKNRERYQKNKIKKQTDSRKFYEKNQERILQKYHEKNPNAKYRNRRVGSVRKEHDVVKPKITASVTKQKKGKTKLKQRLIDNNLKKLKLKSELFKESILNE